MVMVLAFISVIWYVLSCLDLFPRLDVIDRAGQLA